MAYDYKRTRKATDILDRMQKVYDFVGAEDWKFDYHRDMRDVTGEPIVMHRISSPDAPGGFASIAVNKQNPEIIELLKNSMQLMPALLSGAGLTLKFYDVMATIIELGDQDPLDKVKMEEAWNEARALIYACRQSFELAGQAL